VSSWSQSATDGSKSSTRARCTRRARASAGTLDLNTTALDTAFGTQPSLIITAEIEIQNPQNTRRISAQFQTRVLRQIYAGEGAPQPAPPAYPLPAALLTLDQLPAALATANPLRSGRIWANPIEETITHENFTAELSGPPAADGLHLTYIATAPVP
jgi:hypothetical protein